MDSERLNALLEDLSPVDLEELDRRASLQRRTDNKYLVPQDVFTELVGRLGDDHDVLEIDGARSFRYESRYFDTPDLECFDDHVRGRRPRVKVRSRLYVDSEKCSLEVKVKDGDGETVKEQRDRPASDHGAIQPDEREFIETTVREVADRSAPSPLEHAATTRFCRATLVARDGSERITCDTALELSDPDGKVEQLRPDLVLVEVKSEKGEGHADDLLSEAGLEPVSFSKYRFAIGLLRREDPDPPVPDARERWFR